MAERKVRRGKCRLTRDEGEKEDMRKRSSRREEEEMSGQLEKKVK